MSIDGTTFFDNFLQDTLFLWSESKGYRVCLFSFFELISNLSHHIPLVINILFELLLHKAEMVLHFVLIYIIQSIFPIFGTRSLFDHRVVGMEEIEHVSK